MSSTILADQIEEITILTEALNNSKEINIQNLIKATAASQELVNQVLSITTYVQNLELKRFLQELFLVTQKLHHIAMNIEDEIEPDSAILNTITSSFEHFANIIISKEVRNGAREMASYVLALDGVLRCCETIPYYWHHSSTQQKVAMILGATLIAATVGLLIASHVAPALAGIALLPQAITCAI